MIVLLEYDLFELLTLLGKSNTGHRRRLGEGANLLSSGLLD